MRWVLLLLVFAFACPSGSESSEGSSGTEEEIVIDPPPEQTETETETETEAESDGELVVGDDPCESDADCVKASCCHAAACVAADNAPDCSEIMCTADCQFGTTDCGGGCLCHEGRCAARLSQRPDIEAAPQ